MHQESARIEGTLTELMDKWDVLGDCELVVVDDGSTDGSADIAERLLESSPIRATVVRLDRNGGKGAAVAAGVAAARGTTVGFTDADLPAAPDAIAECMEIIEAADADVVVTSRRLPDSEIAVKQPLARRSTSMVFRQVARWAGVRGVTDSQCGLKVFSASAAQLLFRDLSVQRFAFDVEVLLRADLAGLRVAEIPIRWRHVDASSLRTMRDGARMLLDVVRLRTRLRGWEPDDKTPVAAVLEREHWWYVAERMAALDAAHRAGATGPLLELECGTGAFLEAAGAAGLGPVAGTAGHAAGVPAREGSAGAVVALDVLERVDDDVAAVRDAARALRRGGVFIATLPADPRAWSEYDVALGHRRRYSRASARELLEHAGLEVTYTGYFLSWLSPLSFVLSRTPLRAVLLRDPERASFVHRRVNTILRAVVEIERRVAAHVPLPFGQALVVAGRKR